MRTVVGMATSSMTKCAPCICMVQCNCINKCWYSRRDCWCSIQILSCINSYLMNVQEYLVMHVQHDTHLNMKTHCKKKRLLISQTGNILIILTIWRHVYILKSMSCDVQLVAYIFMNIYAHSVPVKDYSPQKTLHLTQKRSHELNKANEST